MSGVYTGYMCECCWEARSMDDRDGAYHSEMKRHEARGCACAKPGLAGAKRRAGQWWDEERQCDSRPGVAELEEKAARAERGVGT